MHNGITYASNKSTWITLPIFYATTRARDKCNISGFRNLDPENKCNQQNQGVNYGLLFVTVPVKSETDANALIQKKSEMGNCNKKQELKIIKDNLSSKVFYKLIEEYYPEINNKEINNAETLNFTSFN